jgi:hypothetical protein
MLNRVNDEAFDERIRALDRRHETFLNRLNVHDQRGTAISERLERINHSLRILAADAGQIADGGHTRHQSP